MLVGHIHVLKHRLRFLHDVLFAHHVLYGTHPEGSVPFGKTGDHHVFHHGQIAKDLWCLEHTGNAHLVDLVRGATQHRLAVKHDRAGVRDELAHKAVQQGGFPGPIGADDCVYGVFLDGEVHVTEGLKTTEPLTYVFDFENSHLSVSLFCGFSGGASVFGFAAVFDPFADTLTTFDQATWQEDHHQHEQDAKGQVPAFADEWVDQEDDEIFETIRHEGEPFVQNVFVDLGQDVFHVLNHTCTKNRADQRANTTQDGHQNNLTRRGPEHTLRANLSVHGHQQTTCETSVHAGDHKGCQRVRTWVQTGV
mmetsp:Transcript_27799/g.35883  ORF Transcript_27799/g.35883 Transcript_27799/m.35883 type:complete len:307 (+) Transcript_27799:1115-2035(+)